MYNDLSRMCRLFERINNGLNILTEYFKKYIVSCGQIIINSRITRIDDKSLIDIYDDSQFIKELIELHNDMLYFVKYVFYDKHIFMDSLNKAFTEIINVNIKDIKSADLLAIYSDKLLKLGGEKMNDYEIENQINNLILLFKYLNDKDIFEDTYRNLLSKRILNQRLTNDDLERQTISKIKLICGSQFTFRLEGMMNDLLSCNNESEHFQEFINNNNIELNNIDFNVQIFTNGYWPLLKSVRINIPTVMQKCVDTFTQFYKNKIPSNKITWQHAYGNVTMKSIFKGKSYDIQVSTLQSIIMIAFNDHETLDFSTLSKITNLEDDILKRVLHSLSCGKFKIIKKLESPDSTDKVVKTTDVFQFNNNFTCPTRKFRIPMASLDDIKSNVKKVEEDRTFIIEASIVRIMKSRKAFLHQSLIAEVLSQLSNFKPDIKQVKKCIESLIDRDYLERDSENNSLYNYLA
jgi:cullin 1